MLIKKTIKVQTKQGDMLVPVYHVNGTLNVIGFPTQNPIFKLYNVVHDNGLRIPTTDTSELESAIYMCDQLAVKFPELLQPSPQLSSQAKDEIIDFLWMEIDD